MADQDRLNICSSTTGEQLSTLSAFKWALYGASTATSTGEDDLLNSFLTAATKTVERYVGYPLRHASYAERVPGFDTNMLMISRTPIGALNMIWHLPEMSVVTTSGYYITDRKAGMIWRDLGWYWTAGIAYDLESHVIPRSELNLFQVDYDAGYVLAGSTTTFDTVPEDIEQAVLDTAKAFYKQVGQDPTISAQRIGDLSITYGKGIPESAYSVTPRAAALLQPWRRII